MEIFNNREIALAIWISILGVIIIYKFGIRPIIESSKNITHILFSKYILSMMFLVTIYVAGIVCLLYYLNLWEWSQLKNTILWYTFIAILLIVKTEKNKDDPHFFKNLIITNFKFVAILEFIVGLYSFSLVVELIVIPIATLASVSIAVIESGTDKTKSTETILKILNTLISVIGIAVILHTGNELYYSFNDITNMETVHNFYTPPLLTLMYLPFIFIFMIYTEYETVFNRLQFSIKDDKTLFYTKLYTIFRFNFRYKKLNRWFKTLFAYDLNTFSDVKKTITSVFRQIELEKNPPEVKKSEGWSPYLAKDFFSRVGLRTDYYHFLHDEVWSASSNSLKINENVFENTISYSISGTETIVKTLNLKLYVSEIETAQEAQEMLMNFADVLIAAIDCNMTKELSKSIILAQDSSTVVDRCSIIVEKKDSSNANFKNFTLIMRISII